MRCKMTSFLNLSVVLLIFAFGQGYASYEDMESSMKELLPQEMLPYSPSIDLVGKPLSRLRRDAAPQNKKKHSLFHRIMSQAMKIRDSHPSHKRLTRRTHSRRSTVPRRSPSRTTTHRRTYQRPPPRRTSYRRQTYRRPSYRRTNTRSNYRRPSTRSRQVVISRRVPSKTTTSKKKPSLFSRIINQVNKIRDDHHTKTGTTRKVRPSSTRWSSRKTVERKPVPRKPVSKWSSRRKPIEKPPPSRQKPIQRKPTKPVPKKKALLFHKILDRVSQIKRKHNQHHRITPVKKPVSKWSSRPKPVEEVPTRSWSSRTKPVEEVPTRSWSSRPKPVEEVPTSSWSSRTKPVEKKPKNSWSSKPKPIEISPVTEVRPGGRVPLQSAPNWGTSIVASKRTDGLPTKRIQPELKKAYPGDEKKIMKVLTWNVFEAKTPRSSLNLGRKEVCDKLKWLKPTVFGLQGALNDQIARLRQCLPRNAYTYYRGRGRYDWGIRKYVYNPIFYISRNKQIKSKGSGTISMRNRKNRIISVATYVKIQYSTKSGGSQQTSTNRRNNIKQLWTRLGHIVNNPHQAHSSSRRPVQNGADTEVLIVNINVVGTTTSEAKRQLDYVLRQIQRLSRYGKTPVILMGDLKMKETSMLYKSLLNNNKNKFDNTLDKSINKNAYPMAKRYISNRVIDYILESKLNTIFAATITDRLRTQSYAPSSQKPVFAAFEMP